ncbi:MAG: hypothetical protein KC433_15450 [Anaerolineales bacterium]|nr:hypothetical protein [Anaerolineales bacterium]MCB8939862.1 hypothetical protein [Ardenticatenaceae bacterium]
MDASRNAQFARLPNYQAYVLRIWQEFNDSAEAATWRFALINTTTNSEHGFASFQELVAFLETLLDEGHQSM